MALRQRLLQDIAELQRRPYPNIQYEPHQDNIQNACLILQPSRGPPLHLTVECCDEFPLKPPHVTIQSHVHHPNVFGDYICASILNTTEGYTPAYTLKGICIQLLSFFSSDSLEQSYGGRKIDLRQYGSQSRLPTISRDLLYQWSNNVKYMCSHCSFESQSVTSVDRRVHDNGWSNLGNVVRDLNPSDSRLFTSPAVTPNRLPPTRTLETRKKRRIDPTRANLANLPDEILVLICNELETEELAPFAQACSRVGGEDGVICRFNLVRRRELICFFLKKDFDEAQLGIGVRAQRHAPSGIESEFDLLSNEAYTSFRVRHSVHNKPFSCWLPLPLTRRHWPSVSHLVDAALIDIGKATGLRDNFSPPDVLLAFMSDVVVKLSTEVAHAGQAQKQVLHASEKAVESYYHLFHLLLCLVTNNPSYQESINRKVQSFLNGNTSKKHVPNLGHLLVMLLVSNTNANTTTKVTKAIMNEAITRNVVWMLDRRGANMPELVYMEADYISDYRLKKTFEASLTSYRLLMFYSLLRRVINCKNKTLLQLRDELFDSYGAPPRGAAESLATQIKGLQQVTTFPRFMRTMGLEPPTAAQFTRFLRGSVMDSMQKGYSVWAISQSTALALRRQKDPTVQVSGIGKSDQPSPGPSEISFFPSKQAKRRR